MRTLRFLAAGAITLSLLWACGDDEDEIAPEPNPDPEPSVEYDEAYYAEHATISSEDANFTVTDDGGEIAFKVEGGEVIVTVDCGTEWTATIDFLDAEEDWLDAAVDCNAGTLTITAEKNTVETEKNATVTVMTAESGIKFATISVTQNAYGACEITVETNEWHAPAVGTLTTEIAVETTTDWEITNTAEWLTAEKTDTGVKLTASENETTEERDAEIVLTCTDGISSDSETINVTQDAKAYITIAEGGEEITFAAEGGSETVEVDSNYDWTPSTDESWISVSNNGNTLTVTVSENESEESREGTITITAGDGAENVAEAIITVSQAEMVVMANPMVLVYSISSANTEIVLPLAGTVECTVDWGDGEVETIATTYPSHTYGETGEHSVSITGTVTSINSSRSASTVTNTIKKCLVRIEDWGETGLEDMTSAFYNYSKLVSIPEDSTGAFANVTSFESGFNSCASLTSLPKGLFDNCTKVTTFESAFEDCEELAELPEGLFSKCTSVTSFESTFNNCYTLKKIPANLFAGCESVTTFSQVFYSCEGVTEIGDGVFSGCTGQVSFSNAFSGCEGLTSIPSDLFEDCTAAKSFQRVFYQCSYLKAIPEGLFKNCKAATDFERAFYKCEDLTGESAYDLVDGNKVHLYERTEALGYTVPTGTSHCYYVCYGLDDYASIPSDWL